MSFNKLMHPRNRYCTPPDFKQLSEEFPEFSKYVIKKSDKYRLDFNDPNALRCLTQTLLMKDFNLVVEIPENSIIPTIPQRLNYILWVEDLLLKLPVLQDEIIKGIDIGTGPCCIFSLLGVQKNNWTFIATETDEESLNCAVRNVTNNSLQDKIKIHKAVGENLLLDVLEDTDCVYDFCLCNPPFFKDMTEVFRKKKLPHFAKDQEIISDGGEVSFIIKIISESIILKDKVRIYTSMLGKKKSMKEIEDTLKSIDGLRYVFTEFGQGNTVRWGVAWTFLPIEEFEAVCQRNKKRKRKEKLLSFTIPSSVSHSIKEISSKLITFFNEFQITYNVIYLNEARCQISIVSHENTWLHNRRRRRQLLREAKLKESTFCEAPASTSGTKSVELNKSRNDAEMGSITDIKRKQDKEDDSCKRLNLHTPDNSSIIDHNNEASKYPQKPLLDGNIYLYKDDDASIILETKRNQDSNQESIFQIHQLLQNRLNPFIPTST